MLRELFAQRQSDGTPAAGNPLWLMLALDLLNLLDVDDFTAAEAAVGGSPEEKLRRLVLDHARALPPDMEGLYGRLLAQVEKVAGIAETRAFAALTALSRHGWREEDFEKLLPTASAILSNQQSAMPSRGSVGNPQFKWDPLRFAVLRRCFRAHLVKRGALEQWDFAHTSLRRAVLARLEGEWNSGQTESLTRVLYACGAYYLEMLPPGTDVRENEIMWQMLGTREVRRVARYYALPTSGSKMLALFLTEDEAIIGHPLRQFVRSIVQAGVAEPTTQAAVAHKFIFDLNDALGIEGNLPLRKELLTAAHASLARLAAADPSNASWQRDLSVSHNMVGEVLHDQGDLAGALKAYQETQTILARLASADPSNAGWQFDFGISNERLGDVLLAQGNLGEAHQAYERSREIITRLASADPNNAGWQRGLSVSQGKIGDVLLAQGNLAGAFAAYREALAISQRLVAADPSNAGWQRDLGVSQIKIGDVLRDQGDLAGALKAYRESLAIRARLAAADPSNAGWQRDLGVGQEKMGNVLLDQGDLAGALKAYRESLAVAARLAAADPSNAGWQRDIFVSYWKLADIAEKSGTGDALEWWRKAFEILSAMKQRGIMLPTDEPHLIQLRQKLEATKSSAPTTPSSNRIGNSETAIDKDMLSALQQRADYFLRKGDYIQAEATLKRALESCFQLSKRCGGKATEFDSILVKYKSLLEKMGRSQEQIRAQLNVIGKSYGISFSSNT